MTEKTHLSIAAAVSEEERAAVQSAADRLARALSQAAGVAWSCDCIFSRDLEALRQGGAAGIIVTSLVPELKAIEEPWSQAEQRLRTIYAGLGKGGATVFIGTILRHVGHDTERETAAALMIRIRRLNLLAAEISRETGAFVIDLDRVLADIGARRLQTDYRLTGSAAAEMAGHCIAITLVENVPNELIPFELQDAAREVLAAGRPAVAEPDSAKPEVTLRKGLMAMGQGRRKQMVSPVLQPVQDNYAGWLVRQVLRGNISPGETLSRLVQAVRKRGVFQSAGLLVTGLSRQIARKK